MSQVTRVAVALRVTGAPLQPDSTLAGDFEPEEVEWFAYRGSDHVVVQVAAYATFRSAIVWASTTGKPVPDWVPAAPEGFDRLVKTLGTTDTPW